MRTKGTHTENPQKNVDEFHWDNNISWNKFKNLWYIVWKQLIYKEQVRIPDNPNDPLVIPPK